MKRTEGNKKGLGEEIRIKIDKKANNEREQT
jgi:hypothetical protein